MKMYLLSKIIQKWGYSIAMLGAKLPCRERSQLTYPSNNGKGKLILTNCFWKGYVMVPGRVSGFFVFCCHNCSSESILDSFLHLFISVSCQFYAEFESCLLKARPVRRSCRGTAAEGVSCRRWPLRKMVLPKYGFDGGPKALMKRFRQT